MAKPRAVWVSRDKYKTLASAEASYDVFATRPKREHIDGAQCYDGGDNWLASMCPVEFERVTGFRLEPGECVRVTIEVKPVAKKRS